MLLGGLQKTSLIDYPSKVSAILFTLGCNFCCPFCYNPELVSKINKKSIIPHQEIFDFLAKRKKTLDAVVITGGEPTLHQDLPSFIKKIKNLDYLIKLDTNGSHPAMLERLIKNSLIDYIAMDIKAPLSKYAKTVKMKISTSAIKKSIKLIMDSGLPYEFRSTILPALHSNRDLLYMAKLIQGAKNYYLQKFVPTGNLNDQTFNQFKSFTDKEMKQLAKSCQKYVGKCQVR